MHCSYGYAEGLTLIWLLCYLYVTLVLLTVAVDFGVVQKILFLTASCYCCTSFCWTVCYRWLRQANLPSLFLKGGFAFYSLRSGEMNLTVWFLATFLSVMVFLYEELTILFLCNHVEFSTKNGRDWEMKRANSSCSTSFNHLVASKKTGKLP